MGMELITLSNTLYIIFLALYNNGFTGSSFHATTTDWAKSFTALINALHVWQIMKINTFSFPIRDQRNKYKDDYYILS